MWHFYRSNILIQICNSQVILKIQDQVDATGSKFSYCYNFWTWKYISKEQTSALDLCQILCLSYKLEQSRMSWSYMAWEQMEKDNKSGKFSKLLKERIKSSWEKLGEVSAAVGEASEERPGLQRKLWAYNPDIFKQVCTQCVCALSSRYPVVWTLGYQPGLCFELAQAEKAGSLIPLTFCQSIWRAPWTEFLHLPLLLASHPLKWKRHI